jgi:hypothetical protein
MQYLNKTFSVGPPSQIFGCEACIYGEGPRRASGVEIAPKREHTCQAGTLARDKVRLSGARNPEQL